MAVRKIILNLAVTLDGFIEGPNGEVEWCRMDQDSDDESFFDKFLPDIDAILYGRVSYDLWGQYQPGPNALAAERKLWETVHSKKKYVFSRQPKEDGKARYIHSDVEAEVQAIKNLPGKDIWLYGGANLITGFINKGLIDTYLLAVFPVILGSGKPLFSGIQHRVNLDLKESTAGASGVMLLRYDVKR